MKSERKYVNKSIALWGLLGLSLILNVITIFFLVRLHFQTINILKGARVTLAQMQEQPFKTVVDIDQDIPIKEMLPFQHVFSVPIDTTYPLSTTISTIVQIPLLGPQEIVAPVMAQIPIQMNVDVPVDTEIPLDFTYHLKTSIPIEVKLPPEALDPIDDFLRETLDSFR